MFIEIEGDILSEFFSLLELETSSDIIKSHLELLVEELDALSFLKPLQDKHILTAGEAQKILEETPISRKSRTRAMIEKILEKDASVVFVDILKEKKKYVWEHIFESKRSKFTLDVNLVI